MKKAFRDIYERELALLYERAAEFAEEYPGLAGRLGGLLRQNTDPAIAGLLEGTAFLASRVQLKMEEEFRTFTKELLDQIFPDALAPTPSVMLVEATPPFDNKDLAEGLHFKPGDYLDARFRDADQRVSCRFSLAAPLSVWPLKLAGVTYYGRPAQIVVLGRDVAEDVKGGLQLDLLHPDPTGETDTGEPMSGILADELSFYFTGDMTDAVALTEQIFCDVARVSLRYLDANGDPVFMTLPPDAVEQLGFRPEERLFPRDVRLFEGFATLREAFVFPRKFLGFRLTGLRQYLAGIEAGTVQVLFEFTKTMKSLEDRLKRADICINAAPAVNLFEEMSSQVRLDRKRAEFVVTPDSSPMTHYEIYQIKEVWAHYSGMQTKVEVHPLYGLPDENVPPRQALYYTSRRKERRPTEQEKRFGQRHRYRGTETFISLYEPPDTAEGRRAQRLQIKTLCSNRHLPEYLPIAETKDNFYMSDDVTVSLNCVAGPTPPRESMTELERAAPHRAGQGDVYWRLISYLSLSHFGLDDRSQGQGAASLREMLSLFADLSDTVTEAQLAGITRVETRPTVRTIRRGEGYHAARGVEVRVTFDETAFEGSGIFLLGVVFDRFFAEYASVNSFTQTVIVSAQRGVVKMFDPRTGQGPLI